MLPLPAMLAIAAAVIAVLSFGGGFAVADWRANGKIEKIQGTNNQLTDANSKCAADIKNAQTAMQAMTAVSIEREKQAQEAQQQAQPQVQERRATITRIKALPTVALDMQCEAIKQEQIDYVIARRNAE